MREAAGNKDLQRLSGVLSHIKTGIGYFRLRKRLVEVCGHKEEI
jgi:hypothetical protein